MPDMTKEIRAVQNALQQAIGNSDIKVIAGILDQISNPQDVVNRLRLSSLTYDDFQSLAEVVEKETSKHFVFRSLASKLQRDIGILPEGESLTEKQWDSIFKTYAFLLPELRASMDGETAEAAQRIKDEYRKTHTEAKLESPKVIARDFHTTVRFYNQLNRCFGGQTIIKRIKEPVDAGQDAASRILMKMRKVIRDTIAEYLKKKVDVLVTDFLERTFADASAGVISGAFTDLKGTIDVLKNDLSGNFHIDNIGSITMLSRPFITGNVDVSEYGQFAHGPHESPRDREYAAQMDVSYNDYKTKFTFSPDARCAEIREAFDNFVTKIFYKFMREYADTIYVRLSDYGTSHGLLANLEDFVEDEPSRIRSLESITEEGVLGLGDFQLSLDSARSIIDRLNRFNRYIPSMDAQVAITNYPVYMAEIVNFVNKNDLHKYLPENSILKDRSDSAFWALPMFSAESDENDADIATENLEKAADALKKSLEYYIAEAKRRTGETPLDILLKERKPDSGVQN
jgi:hypothetical protein